jgi:hypothetical protein
VPEMVLDEVDSLACVEKMGRDGVAQEVNVAVDYKLTTDGPVSGGRCGQRGRKSVAQSTPRYSVDAHGKGSDGFLILGSRVRVAPGGIEPF